MKNALFEVKKLVAGKDQKLRPGVVISNKEGGGFIVQPLKGGQEVVFGDAEVGDTVLYEDGVIRTRLKRESITTIYIK